MLQSIVRNRFNVCILLVLFQFPFLTYSQESSAIFDVASTSKGFLTPRMTMAQRDAIVNPANRLMIYQTDNQVFCYFNGIIWTELLSGLSGPVGETGATGQISNLRQNESIVKTGLQDSKGYLLKDEIVDNTKLIPILLQVQQKQIEELKAKNDNLEFDIVGIKKEMAALKAMMLNADNVPNIGKK